MDVSPNREVGGDGDRKHRRWLEDTRRKQVHHPTAARDATGVTVVQQDGWRSAAPDGQGTDGAHEGAAVEVERVSDQLPESQPTPGRARHQCLVAAIRRQVMRRELMSHDAGRRDHGIPGPLALLAIAMNTRDHRDWTCRDDQREEEVGVATNAL
ncbi:MAG: hypothetical protein ACRDUV_05430 [Pseudonocardiaceae bacterium]